MDRRVTLKWMLAAATLPLVQPPALAAEQATAEPLPYGTDPKLLETYHPGALWPLTFDPVQRRRAAVLCDIIIPADDISPSATAVGVVDFIDEWISAPYPLQRADRKTVLEGLAWFDAESSRRFSKPMLESSVEQLRGICDDICYVPKVVPNLLEAAKFFARYRDLTAGGFYTTPHGRTDLGYVGNTPLPRFDGPPLEVLKKVGLA
jgi:hypothetical protein